MPPHRAEVDLDLQVSTIKPKHPPIVGYHVLISLTAVLVGLTKATLSYLDHPNPVTAIEWVVGGAVSIG